MTVAIQPALVKRDLLVADPQRLLSENPAAVYLAGLAAGSRQTMRHSLDVIALKLSGDEANCLTLDWAKLRYPHTAAIRSWLMDRYQPATVNKMLSALRRVLYHAWKLGQMSAEDSTLARDIATLRYETIPAGRAISHAELTELLAVCSKDTSPTGNRDAAMIAVMYGTGVRRASLTTINLSDYHRENGELVIRAKGNKTILSYLTGGAKAAVEDWLTLRGDEPGPLFCRIWKGGKIKPDTGLSSQAVYDMLRRRSGQTGLSPLTPHDLRRTFVSDLLTAGVDLVTVQNMAGHASPTTTARYDRRKEEIKRKAATKLDIPYTGNLK